MAKEFNLEDSNAYFASDKIKDFVKQQSTFDKLMMSRSALPIASLDFTLGFLGSVAGQATTRTQSLASALFFALIFCCTAYSLNLFSIRHRFDRWQSLLLCLKSWVIAYAFTLGFAPIWIGVETPPFGVITIGAICAGLAIYLSHWYLARGLRRHAFHFVVMGEPTTTTVTLLKEVRRPREVVSYRHIHKLYHLISNQKNLAPSRVVEALIQNEISTIVLTTNHTPSTAEELLLVEAQQNGIDCVSEEELWEDVTKCAALSGSKRDDFLKALEVDTSAGQSLFRRILEVFVSAMVLTVLFPFFGVAYVTASMRIGTHAINKQLFVGNHQKTFVGNVLIFSNHNSDSHKELKIGQHAQNSFFERWCWKSGMWKYPLLLNVIKGELAFVGAPLTIKNHGQKATKFRSTISQRADGAHEASLGMILEKTMRPGIVSHFELVEQEPTYFESSYRSPERYTLYYRKHQSLLLDAYLVGLCLLNKVVGRSPQRAWLEV